MKRRIPQLDAVRGIAILVVMVHNSAHLVPTLPLQRLWGYGWMGVDLFFVLSGYLITGILFDSKESQGYFKNFYARRCLRIWPLYYSVLFLMFVGIPLLRPSMRAEMFLRAAPWWSYLFFLQNFLVHNSSDAIGPLGVTWSVAIEEQFYAVWAVVVRFCSLAQLRWLAIAIIALSPLLRIVLLSYNVDLYTNVFCRLDGLMAGGLLALAVRSEKFLPSRFFKAAWLLLLVALPLACLTDTLNARWMSYSLSAAASAAFVYLALYAPQRWFQMAMRNRLLLYTGVISYGLYLLHKLPFDAEKQFRPNAHSIFVLVVGLVASYAIATASWFLFEQPILKLKRLFEFRTVGTGGTSGELAPLAS